MPADLDFTIFDEKDLAQHPPCSSMYRDTSGFDPLLPSLSCVLLQGHILTIIIPPHVSMTVPLCFVRKQERIVKAVDVSKTLLHYGW